MKKKKKLNDHKFLNKGLGKQCRGSLIWVYTVWHSVCILWKHKCMGKPIPSIRIITAIFKCLNFLDFYAKCLLTPTCDFVNDECYHF